MSLRVLTQGGGTGGAYASIFVTGLSETDAVTATKGSKTVRGKWGQKQNPAWHGLPDGYTELTHIESTGTQYLVPNIHATAGLRVKCRYTPTDTTTDNHVLSVRNVGDTAWLFAVWRHSSNKIGLGFGSDQSKNTLVSYQEGIPIEQEIVVTETNAKGFYNGNQFASIDDSIQKITTTSMYLFCMNNGGSAGYFSKIKMEYLLAEVNGVETHELIPARRNSDGHVAMYNLATGEFLPNAGTGEFIAGEEVPQYIYGHEIAKIKEYGMWTVTATNGEKTTTQDVLVDAAVEFEIEMLYRLYLYRAGDECEDVTGGWVVYPANGSTAVSFAKYSDRLYFDGVETGYSVNLGADNAMDLTNHTKLCAEIQATGTNKYHPWVGISTNKDMYNGRTLTASVAANGDNTTNKQVVCIDITSVTGLHYVYAAVSGSDAQGSVYNIWLE